MKQGLEYQSQVIALMDAHATASSALVQSLEKVDADVATLKAPDTALMEAHATASRPSALDVGSITQSLKKVDEYVDKLKAQYLQMRSDQAAWRSEVAALRSKVVDVATLKGQVAALMEAHATASSASVQSLKKVDEDVATLKGQYSHMKSELDAWKLDAWKPEVVKIVIEHTRAELAAWLLNSVKWFGTTLHHQPPPLNDAAKRDDELESETPSLTSTKWKTVLKKFHPRASILQFLDEDASNRPLLKILRAFTDEFINARKISTARIREIPTEHHADFVEYFVARCKSFTGDNISKDVKQRINSAFDVNPVAENFTVNVGVAKPFQASSGVGRNGSTSKKRSHSNLGTDTENTQSKPRLSDTDTELEWWTESEEAEGV
ncbi:hypothetical protein HDU80_002734 [Chytriomyces hyalinus]|nr:hypothetical protein HDU80_002734 [Chytriomyces hyalinus]